MSISPPTPLAYEGSNSIPYLTRNFAPSPSNSSFNVPTIWIDPSSQKAWMLVAKPIVMGNVVADWSLLTGGSGALIQIDTPTGGPVTPVAGVIDLLNGTGMSISGSGNTITFNAIGGGLTWNSVAGTSQTLVAGNGYVGTNSAQIVYSLPSTANFGDYFRICGTGSAGWTISQGSGQSIVVGSLTSTVGVGGSVTSTLLTDQIELLCIVANTTFKALNWQGNLTVV